MRIGQGFDMHGLVEGLVARGHLKPLSATGVDSGCED